MASGSGSEDSRELLIKRLVKRYEELLRRKLTSGPQTLDHIEREISEISDELNRITMDEKISDAISGSVDRVYECSEGHTATLKSWNSRQITSLHGVVTFRREYCYCDMCRKGFCPADKLLDIDSGEISIGMQALITRLSCYLPCRKAALEVELLTGAHVSHSTVQRVSKAAGQQLGRDWKDKEAQLWSESLPSPERPVKMLQSTLDGVMINVGKQWREVKVGVAYERDGNGGISRASYCATLKPAAEFGRLWHTLNHVAGGGKTSNVGVVADGADWIWKEVGKYRPRSVQILDNMHALDHLWNVAHARFGQGTAEAASWMSSQKDRLDNDEVGLVIRDIRYWRPKTESQMETRRVEWAYIKTHRKRMLYKTFKDQGYHIGSGVVEAANKNVVQARMKRAGMRWQEPGAEAQLQLLTAWNTSQHMGFDDICKRAMRYVA